jgi:hypothetical protein
MEGLARVELVHLALGIPRSCVAQFVEPSLPTIENLLHNECRLGRKYPDLRASTALYPIENA